MTRNATRVDSSDAPLVLRSVERRVSVVTFNRPERLNAVSRAMQVAIAQALHEADHDAETNVIMVTGAGKAFCAGGDVQSMQGSGEFGGTERVLSAGRHLVDVYLRLEKPVISLVNGDAVGLGATLALLGDIVYMSEAARIGDRHVNVGLVAGDGGAILWPLLIGPSRAKELLFTGRLLTGVEAAQMGLVSKALPSDELREAALALADDLAAQPPYALRATKLSINKSLQLASAQTLDLSLAYEHLSMETPEHAAAVRAFLGRREAGARSMGSEQK
jgi:enoyl-CoA hydratase